MKCILFNYINVLWEMHRNPKITFNYFWLTSCWGRGMWTFGFAQITFRRLIQEHANFLPECCTCLQRNHLTVKWWRINSSGTPEPEPFTAGLRDFREVAEPLWVLLTTSAYEKHIRQYTGSHKVLHKMLPLLHTLQELVKILLTDRLTLASFLESLLIWLRRGQLCKPSDIQGQPTWLYSSQDGGLSRA
jgi:hypothetical protein